MDPVYYYRLLGLRTTATLQDIKRAYRTKARLYHPDLNNKPGSAEKFIEATEAYEFLLDRFERLNRKEDTGQFYDEWERYRKNQVRQRAQAYARAKYKNFKNSDLYRTSVMLDKSRLIINLVLSVFIIFCSVYGYLWRLGMVKEGYEKPTLTGFLALLSIGLVFLGITLVYFIAYYQIKYQKRNEKKDKESIQ
ncbi:MAG TPA: DnaJ domain-containing protein [Bacteroidales bacterium]|nr:DnaJ domain-containing protein [Bacteroidales bacterium]